MQRMVRPSLCALAWVSLAACGGGASPDASNSNDYQMAVDAAGAKQAEAVSLAPASPCNAVQQCANLTFVEPMGHCSALSYRPYSLASPTADAASAAAAEERALANHAVAIAPPPPTACTAAITLPPNLACMASTCQVALPAR
jgi:hypothetical protein